MLCENQRAAHKTFTIPFPPLQLGKVFSHDTGVVDATSALATWLAVVVVGDGLNATFSGALVLYGAGL